VEPPLNRGQLVTITGMSWLCPSCLHRMAVYLLRETCTRPCVTSQKPIPTTQKEPPRSGCALSVARAVLGGRRAERVVAKRASMLLIRGLPPSRERTEQKSGKQGQAKEEVEAVTGDLFSGAPSPTTRTRNPLPMRYPPSSCISETLRELSPTSSIIHPQQTY